MRTTAIGVLMASLGGCAPAPVRAWPAGPALELTRAFHGAEILPGDRLLVVGGRHNLHDRRLEPLGIEVIAVGAAGDGVVYPNALARVGHTVTRLADGTILVLGGTEVDAPTRAAPTMRYDPERDRWTFLRGPEIAPIAHTATLLAGGTVLVVGGRRNGYPGSPVEATVMLYDVERDETTSVTPLGRARAAHSATLMADGRVLVVGGWDGGALGDAEVLDPSTRTWSTLAGATPRADHTATRLADGGVMLVGGAADGSCQVFDPVAGSFTAIAAPPEPARSHHTATMLAGGAVLVAGGYVSGRGAIADVAVFRPGANTWSRLAPMSTPRWGHTATRLSDGRVVIAGGATIADDAPDRERMDPYVRATEILDARRSR
jgi:N-acetylneuraminic acid mutarotase